MSYPHEKRIFFFFFVCFPLSLSLFVIILGVYKIRELIRNRKPELDSNRKLQQERRQQKMAADISTPCRMTKMGAMNRLFFKYMSCTQCYRYLSSVFVNFNSRLVMSNNGVYFYMLNETTPIMFDPTVPDQIGLLEGSMHPLEFKKWRECCDAAMECCDHVMALDSPIQGF